MIKSKFSLFTGSMYTQLKAYHVVDIIGCFLLLLNSIPPFVVFLRKRFYSHFIHEGPLASAGAANGSGWMQADEFLQFLQHFANHTKPSLESKVLLLQDNHVSHLSVQAMDLCRERGIILLTFPPQCTHKLCPLDS